MNQIPNITNDKQTDKFPSTVFIDFVRLFYFKSHIIVFSRSANLSFFRFRLVVIFYVYL